jgi:Ca2+-dependent lipid-binding protein
LAPHKNDSGALAIQILEGKNLKAMDGNGLSDPFVKIRYFPPANSTLSKSRLSLHRPKQGEQVLFKTKVQKNTVNPQWNETCIIPFPVSMEDPLILNISVKDHNMIKNVDIGEYELDVWKHILSFSESSVLVETKPGELRGDPNGTLRLQLDFLPNTKPQQLAKTLNMSVRSLAPDTDAESESDAASVRRKGGIFG